MGGELVQAGGAHWNPIGETLIIKTTRIKDVRIFSIELSAILTIS